MNTCAHCGQPLPAAVAACPQCGAPTSQGAQGPGAGDQGMPDWMRGVQSSQTGGGTPPPMGWTNQPQNGAQPGMAPQPHYPPQPSQASADGMPPQGTFSVGQLIAEDALPDWVRSAAADGTPGSPPGGPAQGQAWPDPGQPQVPFANPGALFDDTALPDWLRAAADRQPLPAHNGGMSPFGESSGLPYSGVPGGYNAAPAQTYAAFPGAPAPGQPYQDAAGAAGMPGQFLLDANALPAWLGGNDQPPADGSAGGPLGGGGLSANSLVDQNVLPEWMKQDAGRPPADSMPAAGTVSQWLAGPVTDEPLPGFLDQVYASADVPRLEAASPWGASPYPAGDVRLGAMTAGQLVDPGALPDWLRQQAGAAGPGMAPGQVAAFGAPGSAFNGNGNAGYAFATPPPPPPPPPGAGAVFSAADLIEPDALLSLAPDEPPPPSTAVFSPTSGWTFGEPAHMNTGPGANGGNGAAPPADDANLPEWLMPQGAGAWDGQMPNGTGNGARHGARAGRAPIPDAELPEWLRGGSPAGGNGANGQDVRGGYGPGANGAYAGQGMDEAYPAGDGYAGDGYAGDGYAADASMDGGDYADQYADRFGNEMPGGAGQFSYEYDYGGAFQQDGPPEPEPPAKKRKRKGFFRRK